LGVPGVGASASRRDAALSVFMAAVICAGFWRIIGEARVKAVFSMPACNKVIAIDAGHGGWDPGMVSKSGVEEKGINLLIAEKLQVLLEQSGAFVLLTRADDNALANRKRGDLDARRAVSDEGLADMFISIHQNSYQTAEVHGPMVFYYGDSEGGRKLAEKIQAQMNAYLNPGSKRPAHANSKYYVLKKTNAPSVILECGFLSNAADTRKLVKEEYQEKVAWSIYMGILDYFVDSGGGND
jgi:N-acetylmuramoyl-L-alanine amidase